MATGEFELCALCRNSMSDPRILPCAHTFCLKCLESSTFAKDSLKCPTCQIAFEMPKDGLKGLKKNEFIKNLRMYTLNHTEENRADKNCWMFNTKFTSLHTHQSQVKYEYTHCVEHALELRNLFCEDCNLTLCVQCLPLSHNTHKMKHISDYFACVKDKLEENLMLKQVVVGRIYDNCDISEKMICDNELKASKLKKEIRQRGEDVKEVIDSLVDEMIKNIDEELKEHQKEADNILKELENMKMTFTEKIKTLKQQLNNMNYGNVLEISQNVDVVEDTPDIPKYSERFYASFLYKVNGQRIHLKKIIGTVRKAPKLKFPKEIALDGRFRSFAFNEEKIFLCNIFNPEINSFEMNSRASFGSNSNFEHCLSEIFDLLIINDMLYALGRCCKSKDTFIIVKIDVAFKGNPLMIYKFQHGDKMLRLSNSIFGNIILILSDKIMNLSENGDVLSTISLSFSICDALHLYGQRYVVCGINNEVCIVVGGVIAIKYSPSKACHAIKSPFCLAKDKLGNIFVGDFCGNVFVLDYELNFVSSHVVNDNGNENVWKMCYNEVKNTLMVLNGKFSFPKMFLFKL